MKKEIQLSLTPGTFYRSRDTSIWCCFAVRPTAEPHARAICIRVSDHRIEYFYSDGRYDEAGKRQHTLVAEAPLLKAAPARARGKTGSRARSSPSDRRASPARARKPRRPATR